MLLKEVVAEAVESKKFLQETLSNQEKARRAAEGAIQRPRDKKRLGSS